MKCKECGSEFDDRWSKKFCSVKCKNKHYHRKHPRMCKCPKCGFELNKDGDENA